MAEEAGTEAAYGSAAQLIAARATPGHGVASETCVTTPCDVCGAVPLRSGAQYDMDDMTVRGMTLHVCSNCVHGNPVSITDLMAAADRAMES